MLQACYAEPNKGTLCNTLYGGLRCMGKCKQSEICRLHNPFALDMCAGWECCLSQVILDTITAEGLEMIDGKQRRKSKFLDWKGATNHLRAKRPRGSDSSRYPAAAEKLRRWAAGIDERLEGRVREQPDTTPPTANYFEVAQCHARPMLLM